MASMYLMIDRVFGIGKSQDWIYQGLLGELIYNDLSTQDI